MKNRRKIASSALAEADGVMRVLQECADRLLEARPLKQGTGLAFLRGFLQGMYKGSVRAHVTGLVLRVKGVGLHGELLISGPISDIGLGD